MEKFPYLKNILVQNKIDLESTRQVTSFEINEFLGSNTFLEGIEISLKNCDDNLKELVNKINTAENESKNLLPLNIVSESVNKKINTIMNIQGSLSFILIGDTQVGKTNFLTRYFKNEFKEVFLSTIGIEKEIKILKVGNDKYKLTLWDTAGQERFRALPRKYYQNADGVLLLFDVTLKESFDNISNWLKDVKDNSNKDAKNSDIALYLIGNKIDKPGRVISKETAEAEAKSLGMKYFEISCKLNMNLQEVMARMILECYMKVNKIDNCFTLATNKKQEKKSGCCGEGKKKNK